MKKTKPLLKLVSIGLTMLVLAYPLTFTTEPDLIYGRVTRNHFAGVIGSSLLIAAAWMALIEAIRSKWLKLAASIVLAISFAMMLGFGLLLQRDYARGWTIQQEFWGTLLLIIPDASDGTAIIVDSSGMKESSHIGAMTWNMPRVLERIFVFPESWVDPPSAYKMHAGWLDHLHAGNGTLLLDLPDALTPRDYVKEVTSSDMILIITDGRRILRQNSPIEFDGAEYPLIAHSEPVLPTLERRTFFDLLVLSTEE